MSNFVNQLKKYVVFGNFSKPKEQEQKPNELEILNQIKELNNRIDCIQKSLALLYQVLPDKIREGIVDGLNERNRRTFPL
jgi:hypothetical protein